MDDAPSIIGFPAPWRDLFRKSGRPLEAELARMGYALEPAQPATMIFADGAELTLPTDRGGQYATLAAAYGSSVAERWRDLLDRLDDVWQTLRGLGLEAELRSSRQLNRTARRSLFGHRMTLADLATSIDHDHLGAVIRSVAYRSGSVPEQTPAFAAVELSMQRTFGRWQVQPLDTNSGLDVGRSSVLVEALVAASSCAKCTSTSAARSSASTFATATSPQLRPAMETALPQQSSRPATPGRPSTTCFRPPRPGGPDASCEASARPQLRPSPTMKHRRPLHCSMRQSRFTEAGVPTVSYLRQLADNGLRTTHDFNATLPRASYGVAWSGFASWLRRPLGDDRNPRPLHRKPFIAGRSWRIPGRALRGPRRLRLPGPAQRHRPDRGNFGDPDNFRILRCLFFRVRIILLDTRAERDEFRQRDGRISSR